ncbi:MAG: hypothetical protein RIQ68_1332 [Pseudomonadota bacterium]|jgi:hypothetical protein
MENLGLGPLLLLGVLSAAASAAAGRAVARTWRAPLTLVFYAVLLGLVVEFLSFALFGASLMGFSGAAFAFGWTLLCALIAFRVTRARQMLVQYGFTRTPET